MNNVSYTVSIYDIIANQNNIISNDAGDINSLLSNYGIEHMLILNNIFMPLMNTAVIELTYSASAGKTKLFTQAIAEGNIVKIDEVFNNNYKTVFVGYIATANIGQDTHTGLNITLNCLSLLGQLYYQLVANDINDTLMLGGGEFPITDFVANQVSLGKILLAFQSQALMSYALNYQIIDSYDSYDGERLAFMIPEGIDGLTSNTPVYFFASTNDNRFDSLLRTIYAYQRLIYQDLNGTIKIAIPSAKESDIGNFYYFDIGKFNSTVDKGSIKYDRYNLSKNAGIVCNRAFASLIPAGFNLIGSNEQNTINYVANLSGNLFTRGQALLKTGLFTMSRHDIVDLNDNLVRDPTLLRLFNITQGNNNNIIANDVSGPNTFGSDASGKSNLPVVGLYANRLLAQDAFLESQLEIDLPRLSCYNPLNQNLADIPLGYTVNVNDNGNLGLETSKFYCYQMSLNYDINSGTKLSLGLCKHTGDSGSNPLVVGVLIGVKDLPYIPKTGESGLFSDNWLFMQQNDAIRAYKRNDKDYSATLASGEWLAKFISDLIEDNNKTMREYINNTLNKFVNNHTHSAGSFNIPNIGAVVGESGVPITSVNDINQNDNLTQDQDYINKQNFLLNDNAISIPE